METRQISVIGQRNLGGPSHQGSIAPEKALSEAYYANIYFFACVRAIATDLAARPFRVGADPDTARDFDPRHPLARRLSPPPGGPNGQTSARRLWAWSAAQRLVLGAVAWEIDSNLDLWPLPGTKLTPVVQDDPRRVAADGWFKEFKVGSGRHGKVLKPREVFYSWNPAQDDWTRPETALEAARLDVQVAVMQDIYDNAFLRNDARPAQIIVHQAFERPEDESKFRRQFLNRHQGPANAGRAAFVRARPENGGAAPKDAIFIQQLGLSQRDAQFIERYEQKLRSICIALGVPLSRLGDASKRTFSNADKETVNYWLDTVQPLGHDLADDVNIRLMPLYDNSGNVGWFDWSGVPDLEPPKRFAVGEVLSMRSQGLITGEEARDELGFDPDGLPDAPAIDPAPAVEPPPLPVAAAAPSLTAEDVAAIVSDALAPVQAALRVAPVERRDAEQDDPETLARERRRALWRSTDQSARRIERSWESKIDRLFARQRDAILTRLEGKRGRQMLRDAEDAPAPRIDADAIFDRAFWLRQTEELSSELFADTVAAALIRYEAQFGISLDVESEWARDYIATRSNYLAGRVTETTYDAIKGQLIDGISEGESIDALADRIRGLFETTWANRAETVARTEVISAYNGSTFLATQNAPDDLVGGLVWISTFDERTRPEHADMDGTIIERGEAFELDGYSLEYPGDPNVAVGMSSSGDVPDPGSAIINCRCTVAPVLWEDMPGEKPERAAAGRIAMRDARALVVDVATGVVPAADALARLRPPAVRHRRTPHRCAPEPRTVPAPVAAGPEPTRVIVEVRQQSVPLTIQRDADGNIVSLAPSKE